VIRRLYVHNFRCLENFELPVSGKSSVLLIGKNGTGKTTVGLALEILQRIARGANRAGDLVKPKDLARGRTDVPMRFEIEVELEAEIYKFTVAFLLPKGFKEHSFIEKIQTAGRNGRRQAHL
jgi:predicted ATPase